eukprot:gene677-414_t
MDAIRTFFSSDSGDANARSARHYTRRIPPTAAELEQDWDEFGVACAKDLVPFWPETSLPTRRPLKMTRLEAHFVGFDSPREMKWPFTNAGPRQ